MYVTLSSDKEVLSVGDAALEPAGESSLLNPVSSDALGMGAAKRGKAKLVCRAVCKSSKASLLRSVLSVFCWPNTISGERKDEWAGALAATTGIGVDVCDRSRELPRLLRKKESGSGGGTLESSKSILSDRGGCLFDDVLLANDVSGESMV